MKVQTRLSGLLFFLLLGLCAGSALVVREALRSSADAQESQLGRLTRRVAQSGAQQAAWLQANTLQALLASRLAQVAARGEALASAPGPGEALVFRSPEGLRRVHETLTAARQDLRFLRLIDATGQLVHPPVEPEAAWVRPPVSLLDPPAQNTVPFQEVLKSALEGTPVISLEAFSPDLLQLLGPRASEAGALEKEPALILMALYPVRGPDRAVVGAVVGGLEVARDSWLQEQWRQQLSASEASAALVYEGKRVTTVGEALEKGSSLPQDAISTLAANQPQRVLEEDAALVRLPLRNRGEQTIGAIEVRVPAKDEAAAGYLAQSDENRHEQLFQRALSLIAILGVVTLLVGSLVSRGLVHSLIKLSRRAELVSTGKLDASFKDLSSRDEVGDLARSFERMRISLRKLLERQQRQIEGGEAAQVEEGR